MGKTLTMYRMPSSMDRKPIAGGTASAAPQGMTAVRA
jgi:hypothetical protein